MRASPSRAQPHTIAVELWPLALDPGPSELAVLRRTLAADELDRAGRYRSQRDADRFVAARGLLRRVLSRLAGREPAALRFQYGAFGKPALTDEPALRFNLAHSEGVALLAVAAGAEVGVDLECRLPAGESLQIARHCFSTRELGELAALPEGARDAAFLRCWTHKEAYVKALGDGLQAPLNRFAVSLAPGGPASLLWTECGDGQSWRWTLADVSHAVPGATAAVCVQGRAIDLRTHADCRVLPNGGA